MEALAAHGAPPGPGTSPPALEVQGLSKRYGTVAALTAASFVVRAGTVHALVGANGAGKSTCLGILAGRVAPTEGAVSVFGEPMPAAGPRRARQAGIAAVYQELMMIPHLSTQANVFLGQELGSAGLRSEQEMRERFRELCDSLGMSLQADVPVSNLSVADQQLVEIMRGLVSDPRILLFDEPTASLAPHERDALFTVIRDLRARGVTVIFVSHNLDEVLSLADDVTVFRNGQVVASSPAQQWSKSGLVESMLGHPRARIETPSVRVKRDQSAELLEVHDLEVPGILEPLSFAVADGEILGVGGLVGSGRTTLVRALAGLEPHSRGRIVLEGREVRWPRSPRAAQRLGIAMVPEDRGRSGVFAALSAAENIVIGDLRGAGSHGLLSPHRTRKAAAEVAASFGIAASRLATPAGQLSGGNQQKLLLARWAHCRPRILLLDEPTRGVDVGAKDQIMGAVHGMAAAGMGVVMVSSEFEEIVDNADRVIVLSEGRLAGESVKDDHDFNVAGILHMAFRADMA